MGILKDTYPHVEEFLKNNPDHLILFLDIDGVLNSEKFFYDRAKAGEKYVSIDDEAVKELNRLPDNTAIVISSSWGYNNLTVSSLKGHGLRFIVLCGICPEFVQIEPRGVLVKRFTEAFGIKKYAILDDVDDFLPEQKYRTVLTDGRIGLTEKDVERIRLLF